MSERDHENNGRALVSPDALPDHYHPEPGFMRGCSDPQCPGTPGRLGVTDDEALAMLRPASAPHRWLPKEKTLAELAEMYKATSPHWRMCGPCTVNPTGCNLLWTEANQDTPLAGGDEVCATNADARFMAAIHQAFPTLLAQISASARRGCLVHEGSPAQTEDPNAVASHGAFMTGLGSASVSPTKPAEYLEAEKLLRGVMLYAGAWEDGDNAFHALGHIRTLISASAPILSCYSCDDPDPVGPRSADEMKHCRSCYAVLRDEADDYHEQAARWRERAEKAEAEGLEIARQAQEQRSVSDIAVLIGKARDEGYEEGKRDGLRTGSAQRAGVRCPRCREVKGLDCCQQYPCPCTCHLIERVAPNAGLTPSTMAGAFTSLVALADGVDRRAFALDLDGLLDRVRRETIEACAALVETLPSMGLREVAARIRADQFTSATPEEKPCVATVRAVDVDDREVRLRVSGDMREWVQRLVDGAEVTVFTRVAEEKP